MKTFIKYSILLILGPGLLLNACKKQDEFLNVKQNLDQVVPSTLSDFQAIMDNTGKFNKQCPLGMNGASDNLVVPDARVLALPTVSRNVYLWAKDLYQGANSADWNEGYQIIEYSNIVLDGLSAMNQPSDPTSISQYQNIKGQALFFRTFAFYMLAGEFCKPYISQSASSDLGIVLRLTSDVGAKSVRSSVQQTYEQMIGDLKTAIPLLPVSSSVGYQMRPTQPAAYALLAKIYLAMSDYKDALTAASNSLNEFSTLLDFNSTLITPGTKITAFPAYPNNPEISFFAVGISGDSQFLVAPGYTYSNVDPALYNSYDNNDLRKTIFYAARSTGGFYFSNNYIQAKFQNFVGIATNEVLLIKAECEVRLQNVNNALSDLNSLLVKRYKTGTYVPVTINDPVALLSKILLERRKELPFTGQVRWEDLRRLNQDPTYAVTLTRTYQGQMYTLLPNDVRYVLPIPDLEIQLTGIQQNQR